MGLKTTNYTVARTGETYETAYALVKAIHITGEFATASFFVHRNREKCKTLSPLETRDITFEVKRHENPFKTAYDKAKEVITSTYTDENGEEKTVECKGIFGGWEDDLIDSDVNNLL